MANEHQQALAGWSGTVRTAAQCVGDYDWDQAIGPGAAEIARLIAGSEDAISGAFWEH